MLLWGNIKSDSSRGEIRGSLPVSHCGVCLYTPHSPQTAQPTNFTQDTRIAHTDQADSALISHNPENSLTILECQEAHNRPSSPHSQGETIAQSNTAKRSFFRKQGEAAVSLVNTKIVLESAIDSTQDLESSADSATNSTPDSESTTTESHKRKAKTKNQPKIIQKINPKDK